jgi:hypothetical protein
MTVADLLTCRSFEYAKGVSPFTNRPHAVYSDGGLCGASPSLVGGSFAFCHVSGYGDRTVEGVGHVRHPYAGLPFVSCNLTEFVGLLCGLELCPTDWNGTAYTDSLNTIRAFRDTPDDKRPKHLPAPLWARRTAVLNRLGDVRYVLLSGHPTRKELAAGVSGEGRPVSPHNVYLDALCTREATYLTSLVTAGQ